MEEAPFRPYRHRPRNRGNHGIFGVLELWELRRRTLREFPTRGELRRGPKAPSHHRATPRSLIGHLSALSCLLSTGRCVQNCVPSAEVHVVEFANGSLARTRFDLRARSPGKCAARNSVADYTLSNSVAYFSLQDFVRRPPRRRIHRFQ